MYFFLKTKVQFLHLDSDPATHICSDKYKPAGS